VPPPLLPLLSPLLLPHTVATATHLSQVYTVSGGKNIPAWLSDKKKKALRKDEEYRRRIELIQVQRWLAAGAIGQ